MKMDYGNSHGHKGTSGAYGGKGSSKGGGTKNPLKGTPMKKGPKDLSPSHKGYAM